MVVGPSPIAVPKPPVNATVRGLYQEMEETANPDAKSNGVHNNIEAEDGKGIATHGAYPAR